MSLREKEQPPDEEREDGGELAVAAVLPIVLLLPGRREIVE